MAIDLNGINVTKLKTQADRAETTNRGESSKPGANPREGVELSANSNVLTRLEQQVRASESFDEQRVAEISQAISEGQYPVDSHRIAQKFLELESQLS